MELASARQVEPVNQALGTVIFSGVYHKGACPLPCKLLPKKYFEDGASCAWSRGNQFSVYPSSRVVAERSAASSCEQSVLNIKQNVLIFSPILRKLVNESNGTFLALQKVAEPIHNSDNLVELLKLSRQYRSVIRVCIENLQDAIENEKEGLKRNELTTCLTIFYSIECVWHLCEILFIDSIPGEIVLPHLLEWVRFNFPCHEQVAAQILEACEKGSESHSEYWPTVIGMIVQGRVDVVRALLRLHSKGDLNEFRLVDNTLKTMPVYTIYGGLSTGDFMINWKHWQTECRARLSGTTFSSEPHLELIMRLIVGDYSAFELIRDRYESWFDLLGGWVMFKAPWARRHELAEHAHACAGMKSRMPDHNRLHTIVLALCEGDLHQVIHEIQQVADNGWFATHLTDILYHSGKLNILDRHQTNVANRLRESLILEYGCMLMEHKSLWSVGLSYLGHCPTEGIRRAEILVERLALHSEKRVLRIIAEAKKYGLRDMACVSSRHASAGRAGAALAWAVRARSAALASRAADTLLRRYVATRQLSATDLLLSLGSAMLISDRLLLLGKYCEFHRLYKKKEFKSAGKLLISLITSKIAPDYFWETLLLDTLPLLESDEVILSSVDTFEIMLCVEQCSKHLDSEKADLLRLALTRNLARTSLAIERTEQNQTS
ncbi:Nuclear pore complex protein Nup85 [Eumeta japonica]|uniref:Nuclear pore complex protein Nup85 n=1 Tax=Eumeta variegata TaxID=151549 RepID=A0A4C1UWH2_EUMVA|nr:Nuclear pore complex protein Nup85 [Eumeta japonica]